MPQIKIKQEAYKHNLEQIALKAKGIKNIICVLKDNAYGHGAKLIAPLAKSLGVEFIALKNEKEALELQTMFENILILSHRPNGKENEAFIYAINDIKDIHKFKQGTKIHIAVDTGMHRNGIKLNELEKAFKLICEYKLQLLGAFTHFSNADEMDASFFVQKELFKQAKSKLNALSQKKLCFHSYNSAALLRCDCLPEDELCRVGLVQFGYGNETLKKVLSLHAFKLSSRALLKGEALGYGRTFIALKDMQIATYDLGYADGLFRCDTQEKLCLADGTKLLGRISMDSFSCEDKGDEVCVFDDAEIWAKAFKTISYEILVKLHPNIPRVLI